MSAVDIEGLTVKAGSKVLVSNVTLAVEAGTWCTIVGPNGAGKTTLVEAVAGLRKPSHGSVSISGHALAEMPERERARRVALVPQQPVIPSGMSVEDYVALGRVAHHGLFRPPSASDRRIVESVLERLSLVDFRERDVMTLSGGERQRMVLARALVQSTAVIVLDEAGRASEAHRHGEQLRRVSLPDPRGPDPGGLDPGAIDHPDRQVVLDGAAGDVIRSDELAQCYGMKLRVVDVDGADVVVPVRR